jgi:hypothetical protein
MAAIAASAAILAGTATAAQAAPRVTPVCTLAWNEHGVQKVNRHVQGKFEITCDEEPAAASGFVQIEWYNPHGGSGRSGGWERAGAMPPGWPPNHYQITLKMLPLAGGYKVYTMDAKCRDGWKMRMHAKGSTTGADGTLKRFNIYFPSREGKGLPDYRGCEK